MVVQTFTLKEFQGYINKLPAKLEKQLPTINKEMADSLVRRIRFRAPSGSTGSLKSDIKSQVRGKDIVITGPGHWSFVNAGVAPDKMIPIEFFEMHQSNPGSTAGRTTNIPNPKGWVMANFHGGKGFVDKSIQAADKDSLNIIERGLNRAFSK